MIYLFIMLGLFVLLLLVTQIVLFELSYKRVKKSNNVLWYLSLDKPFNYTRTGYIAFICFICYLMSSDQEFLSINWIIYFVLFVAIGVISDAIVQYLTLKYAQLRCKKEITLAKDLKQEVLNLKDSSPVNDYEISNNEYDEKEILKNYIVPEDHLAFLSVDGGKFARSFSPLPKVTYDVEPYGDIEAIKANLEDTNIKPTTLTQAGQMPFKDDKIDVVMNEYCNYDKYEIKRVLKPNGYCLINQNGTGNLKEIRDLIMPISLNGEWNVSSCSRSLEEIGLKVISHFENHGYIKFHSIQGMYTYFKQTSPDLCDINKYINIYIAALKSIKEGIPYTISKYNFLVIAKNED